jgi:hypothetical protein
MESWYSLASNDVFEATKPFYWCPFRKYSYNGESWFQKCLSTSSFHKVAHFVELGPFCNMNFDALLESEEENITSFSIYFAFVQTCEKCKMPTFFLHTLKDNVKLTWKNQHPIKITWWTNNHTSQSKMIGHNLVLT